MEKIMVAQSRLCDPAKTVLCATRYGNVMASRGSVIPLFAQQIRAALLNGEIRNAVNMPSIDGKTLELLGPQIAMGNRLGKFDPKTEKFEEFPLPGPEASPYAIGVDPKGIVWYSSHEQDILGRFDPKTGDVIEYPYMHSEISMREFFTDSKGRMWYASSVNNKIGYWYYNETPPAR